MKTSYPKSIKVALDDFIQRQGIGKQLKRYEILERWKEIVGEQIANVTIAERFDGDTLIVRVLRSTWRNELIFLKKEIICQANKVVNADVVKEIIFC